MSILQNLCAAVISSKWLAQRYVGMPELKYSGWGICPACGQLWFHPWKLIWLPEFSNNNFESRQIFFCIHHIRATFGYLTRHKCIIGKEAKIPQKLEKNLLSCYDILTQVVYNNRVQKHTAWHQIFNVCCLIPNQVT